MISMQNNFNETVCVQEEIEKPGLEQNVIINTLDEIVISKTRKLGTLEGKGTVVFAEDWNISDEELCR